MTRGGVPSLRALHAEGYSDAARWFEIYVREAHPGEHYPAPRSLAEKERHAREFRQLERIPWPVLVDDLAGSVHQIYGELPNSAYVIDAAGRIAYKDQWASAPNLKRALDELRALGGTGAPVAGGVDRAMHLLGPTIFGWEAIRRGGRRAIRDTVLKAPPIAAMLFLGQYLAPILSPLARRTRPLPILARAAVLTILLIGLALAIRRSRAPRRRSRISILGWLR